MHDEQRARPSAARGWTWVFILVLAYVCSYVDRQILSLLVDPIERAFGITDSQFSLIHGLSFALLYCILGVPIGSIVDRFDRRLLIGGGVLVWSAMTALCGITQRFSQLFVARVGVGVGEATLSPSAYSLLSDCFPRERLGRAMSVYIAGAGVGAGLAFMFGGWLISYLNSHGPYVLPLIGAARTWQLVFFLVSLPGLPVALLVLTMREPARQGRLEVAAPSWMTVIRFLGARKAFVLPFILGMSFAAAISLGSLAWLAAYLMRAQKMDPAQAGVALGLTTMTGISLGLVAGALINERLERRGVRNPTVTLAAASVALTVVPAAMLPIVTGHIAVFLTLLALFAFTNVPFGIAGAVLQSVTPNQMRGRVSALYLFAQNVIGMVLGPLLPALLTDYEFRGDGTKVGYSLALAIGIFGALGVILLLLCRRRAAQAALVLTPSLTLA